jgi:hypothetical protein
MEDPSSNKRRKVEGVRGNVNRQEQKNENEVTVGVLLSSTSTTKHQETLE